MKKSGKLRKKSSKRNSSKRNPLKRNPNNVSKQLHNLAVGGKFVKVIAEAEHFNSSVTGILNISLDHYLVRDGESMIIFYSDIVWKISRDVETGLNLIQIHV